MAKPTGYAIITEPDGARTEWDTFACCHCNAIRGVKNPDQGWCMNCAKPICGPCSDIGRCIPLEKKFEKMESRDRLRRSILG